MNIVSLIASIAYYLLLIFFFAMWARFVLDLVRAFNRAWRPRTVGLVLSEGVYVVTDPPIKFFRRVMPPLSMGPVAIDFGWSITMLCCVLAMWVALFVSAV